MQSKSSVDEDGSAPFTIFAMKCSVQGVLPDASCAADAAGFEAAADTTEKRCHGLK